LLRLSLEKLVNIIPRRGIAVSTIALSDLQHLYELRLSIETLAIRLAAQRGTKEQWQKMEDALDQVRAGSGRVSNETMIAVDEQCHQIIHDASGNPFLRNTATTLYAASLRLWYYCISEIGPMRQAVLEHEHMLAALRAGDEDQASSLMERHIRTFHQEIQRAIGAAELPQTLA
ncbi:MAG: GntR family transcriptional regulator, partial [Anaerolineales bacterium]